MLYFVSFRSVREKLQSTVSLDHPVGEGGEEFVMFVRYINGKLKIYWKYQFYKKV